MVWINQSFPLIFPGADDPLRGEIAYRDFVATRDSLADAGVTVHPVLVAKSAAAFEAARAEAEAIVETIAAEWTADPGRKIAVLVSARNHLAELVRTMRRRHPEWSYSAVEIEALLDRQPVQDLISLTRALHHRADRLHWLAILRAPWCGLVLADLHALASDDHRSTLWTLMNDATRVARLSADGQHRLLAIKTVLSEALAGQGRQTRRRWIEDTWKKIGGPGCLSSTSDFSDVEAFFSRLDQLDASGQFSIDSLETDMEKLFAAPDSRADGRLELMTIHKAKGLEFDTVILPGLDRRSRANDPPLLAWDSFPMDDGEQLLVAPLNRRAVASTDGPSAYDYLQQMEAERKGNEAARVLYVAATRTVRRLHIFGVCKVDEQGLLVPPQKATGLGRLWPAMQADFERAIESGDWAGSSAAVESWDDALIDEDDESTAEMADFVPALVRLKTPYVPSPQWQAPLLALPVADANFSADQALAATIGTLAHACMEQIVVDSAAWTVSRIEGIGPSLDRWLASRGCNAADAITAARRVMEMLTVTLTSQDGQWVLARHEDDAAELALSTTASWEADDGSMGAPQTRVVDRSFIDGGERWIIDYKTADLGTDVAISTLQEHAERFRPQLEQYARLFQSEARPIHKAIFYLAHGRLVELE